MNLLRRLVLPLAAALTLGVAHAAPPLLSPAELKPLLSRPDVRVLDIRSPEAYAEGHVPGALHAPYGAWRGPASSPGELPALPKLTELVRRLGLTAQTHAIVVSTGDDPTDFGAAARVYWTLKVLGLRELSVLNGGVAAWEQAGLALETEAAKVAPSGFSPTIDTAMIVSRDEVRSRIESGQGRLVDARPANFFRGETSHQASKVPGTLRGAVNFEHSSWFVPGTSTFVSVDEARRIAATAPVGSPEQGTVSFCNTGHWAATNWFALSEVAGQKNVRMYAGSMVDWTQHHSSALMSNVPSRLDKILGDAKQELAKIRN